MKEIIENGKIVRIKCRNHPRDIEYAHKKYEKYDLIDITTLGEATKFKHYALIPRSWRGFSAVFPKTGKHQPTIKRPKTEEYPYCGKKI